MKALLASSLLLAAPFCARAAVSAPADPTAELDHEDSRASAAALQQRLQALRRASPDVAAELSAFVQDQPADLKRKALAVGLRLTGELESLVALERRRAALGEEEYARQRGALFEALDGAMLRGMPRDMHESFMRRMAPLLRQLDRELVHRHADRWKAADPRSPAYHFSAAANLADRRYPEAAADASRAASLDPENAQAFQILADAQYKLGDYAASQEAARRLLALEPDNAVGQAYLHPPGRDPAAGAADDASAGLAPADPGGDGDEAVALRRSDALAQRAKTALRDKDYSLAIQSATEALQARPDNVAAKYYRALAEARKDRFKEALQDIEEGLGQAPEHSPLLAGKALIHDLMGLYPDALEDSDRALRADANSYDAFFTKAWALAGLGRRADALTFLKRAANKGEYAALQRRVAALPRDADVLPLFRGDLAAVAPAPAPAENEKRYIVYGLLILVSGFLIALGVLHHLFGGRVPASSPPDAEPQAPALGLENGTAIAGASLPGLQVLRRLGVGGMGVVYEALDQRLDRKVAIKRMREEICADPREKERFLREARTVAHLRHPNIVEIYYILNDGEYLVFEHVDGQTVHELIQAGGKLSLPKALEVLRGTCAALDYAHARGVIHRDLKPSNIMVDREGKVRVMDFGVARQAKDSLSRLSMTNTVVGTPPYMAPEQEQGVVRKESDVYALAICLFEMLTGQLPFSGVGAGMLMAKLNKNYIPPTRMTAGLPEGIDEVLANALNPDPDLRIRSAGEFLAALEALSGLRR